MFRGIRLLHNAKDAPKTVDKKIIGMVTANEFENRFPYLPQHPIVLGFKWFQLAFGRMKNDPHWKTTPRLANVLRPVHGIGPVGSWMGTNGVPVVHAQPITKDFEVLR